MNSDERLSYLNQLLAAIEPVWPRLSVELAERIEGNTERLIAKDDEQLRGRIKELRELIDLPATLKSERDHITAELSERDSAD